MSSLITGTDFDAEPFIILGLAMLVCVGCFVFWLCVIKPVQQRRHDETPFVEFRRQINDREDWPCH